MRFLNLNIIYPDTEFPDKIPGKRLIFSHHIIMSFHMNLPMCRNQEIIVGDPIKDDICASVALYSDLFAANSFLNSATVSNMVVIFSSETLSSILIQQTPVRLGFPES